MTVYRVYAEPYKADVTLVVGGWTLLNLLMAGCALGVVSERGERSSSRRVRVNRRCEFGVGDKWYPASIEDVSVHGATAARLRQDVRSVGNGNAWRHQVSPL